MELVCIYIDEYKGIKDLFMNLNQNFICDFDRPHIKVKKQHCGFKEEYYRGQNIKLIIGKNGAGKTSILEFIEGAFNEIVGIGTAVFWNDVDSNYYVKNNSLSGMFLNGAPINEYKPNNSTSLLFITNLFDLNKFAFNEHSKGKKNVLKLSSNKFLEKRVAKKELLMAEVSRELEYSEYFNHKKQDADTPLAFRFTIYPSSRRHFNNSIDSLTNENVNTLFESKELRTIVEEALHTMPEIIDIETTERVFKINNLSDKKEITPKILKSALNKLLKKDKFRVNKHYLDDSFWYILDSCIDDVIKSFSLRIKEPTERAWFYVKIVLDNTLSIKELPQAIKDHIDEHSLLNMGDDIENIVYEAENFCHFLESTVQKLLDDGVPILHGTETIYFDLDNIDLITDMTRKFNELNRYAANNFTYGWYGLSSGEEARLKLQSRIFSGVRELISKGYSNIQLLIDEVDAYLHPEWQRKIVLDIIEILNNFEKPIFLKHNIKKISVNTILTTHSPIILSDFLPDDIISIIKYNNQIFQEKSNGFGTRINDLYLDGMHLDSTFGEISRNEILRFYQELKQGELSNYSQYLINLIPDEKVKAYFMDENDKNK